MLASMGAQAQGRSVVMTGELEVVHIDEADGRRTRFEFLLEDDATGDLFNLDFPGKPPPGLVTGKRVTVHGRAEGRDIAVDLTQDAEAGGGGGEAEAGDPAALELRKAVVVLISFSGGRSPVLSQSTVTGYLYDNNENMDELYQTASHGTLGFEPDATNDGQADVFGPYLVTHDGATCSSSDRYNWTYEAEDLAFADGVDLSLYRHRIFVTPPYSQISCGWAGVANVGCSRSDQYSNQFCRSWTASSKSGVLTHEVGHNLNFAHSSKDLDNNGTIDSEYGDTSDPMGSSSSNWYLFNGPHNHQLGWLDTVENVLVDVFADGLYSVHPLERDGASQDGTRVLRIAAPNRSDYYYLSYRKALGGEYDDVGSSYVNRLSVHRYRGAGYYNTLFIDALAAGESFTDDVNGFTVTATGEEPDGAMGVDIQFGCAAVAPSVTLDPNTVLGMPGADVIMTANVVNNDASSCGQSSFDVFTAAPVFTLDESTTLNPGTNSDHTFALYFDDLGSSDGTYSLTVTADGGAGHLASAMAEVVIDGTPPFAPVITDGSVNKKGRVSLSWTASDDGAGSGIDHYEVYRDGAKRGDASGTSYSDTGGSAGDLYQVNAVDGVGLKSLLSDPDRYRRCLERRYPDPAARSATAAAGALRAAYSFASAEPSTSWPKSILGRPRRRASSGTRNRPTPAATKGASRSSRPRDNTRWQACHRRCS
jgi:hypothetical protein